MPASDEDRIQQAENQARQLGYSLFVTEAPNQPAPITHMVTAAPYVAEDRIATGRFLALSTSAAEAAEAGAAILRGIKEKGDPWPD